MILSFHFLLLLGDLNSLSLSPSNTSSPSFLLLLARSPLPPLLRLFLHVLLLVELLRVPVGEGEFPHAHYLGFVSNRNRNSLIGSYITERIYRSWQIEGGLEQIERSSNSAKGIHIIPIQCIIGNNGEPRTAVVNILQCMHYVCM